MFTAIYRDTLGKADIAILATRNTRLPEAMADITAQTEGPGGLRLATTTRVNHLLEKAQHNLETLRSIDPAKFDQHPNFLFNDPDLGLVTVTWVERA